MSEPKKRRPPTPERVLGHLQETAWRFAPNDAYRGQIDDDAERIGQALIELAALRAWRSTAEPLLRAFRDMVIYREEAPKQIYCRAWGDSTDATYDRHAPDCPVVQIGALLGEGGLCECCGQRDCSCEIGYDGEQRSCRQHGWITSEGGR